MGVIDGLPDAGAARRAAERLLATLVDPIDLEPGQGAAIVGASIGAAVTAPPAEADAAGIGDLASRLLRTADEAMYRAKRGGGGSILVVELTGADS